MDLLRKKTTWVGIISILAGVIEGLFDGDWGSASTKVLAGLAMVTGRHALQKTERQTPMPGQSGAI